MRVQVKVSVEAITEVELTEDQLMDILTKRRTFEEMFVADCFFGPADDSADRVDLSGNYGVEVLGTSEKKNPMSHVSVFAQDQYRGLEEAQESGGVYTAEVPPDPHAAVLTGLHLASQCINDGASKLLPLFTEMICEACEDNGRISAAVALMPQSSDGGETVTYARACAAHREDWWDGADWDGRHLEKEL